MTTQQQPQHDRQTNATGECFVNAWHFLVDTSLISFRGTPYLVHGIVWDDIIGYHCHGWVEDDLFCYDTLDGKVLMIRKKQYYGLGKIKTGKGEIFRYTRRQTMENAAKSGFYYFSNLPCEI